MSSIVLPTGDPEGLNTHAHSEQPQTETRRTSLRTSLRLMVSRANLAIWCGYAQKPPFLIGLGEAPHLNTQTVDVTDGEGLLSVGYPTKAGIAISIRGHP